MYCLVVVEGKCVCVVVLYRVFDDVTYGCIDEYTVGDWGGGSEVRHVEKEEGLSNS